MPRRKKVEDNPSLERDTASNAVINTNTSAYENRLKQIEKSKVDAQQSEDIIQLKKDVEEIKKLLEKIASK
tara:strand:+ start:1438 stop:1650 length:213 start_codon:yes stop_codon:yes gene_type:complete